MMWRIIRSLERIIAWYDRKNGLKTRDEAFRELVTTDLELRHLKLDLEKIPDGILQCLRDLLSEDFHKASTKRPNLSLPKQEQHLQQYIDLALKMGLSAEEILDLDHVEFRLLIMQRTIENLVRITELRSGVQRDARTTLLHAVSDAAEAVGL